MTVVIGSRRVGKMNPCFLIAEIGSNHNQNFDMALECIDRAALAGVDAVKFQTFRANRHVSKYAEMPSYLKDHGSIHDLIQSLELNRDWHKPLKDYAEKKGLIFFSSPCDTEAVDQLEEIGVAAHKVASFDLPDLDLIRYIAKTQKPIILSTGLADWMEIQRAVDACREVGNNKIILLQCTSLYPAPPSLSNLRAMRSMREMLGVEVGYSDHTIGDNIPIAAVAMGAIAIEKHFTIDRTLPGPDHSFAMEPDEFRVMVSKIREVESAFGNGEKVGPRLEEMEMFHKARRSLHAGIDISKGDIITESMIVCKRPGKGIPMHMKDIVIGRRATSDIPKDHWIDWSHV